MSRKRPTELKNPPQKKNREGLTLPPDSDWRTSDQDEINRRILRAQEEKPRVRNLTPEHPIFSNFGVKSASGMDYEVEIRHLTGHRFFCSCTDFRINGLGTCKHVEAVLLHVARVTKSEYQAALKTGSQRIDIIPDVDHGTLRVERNLHLLPPGLASFFDAEGFLLDLNIEDSLKQLRARLNSRVRVSLEVDPWLSTLRIAKEKKTLRREYELGVQSGLHPAEETLMPLFPYQREGMLHLAFNERALLADEMGLGKTIQAIAACALLHRLGRANRVLIVSPASLKTEWEEQICRFTTLPYQLVYGSSQERLGAYAHAPFFTVVNYEQMVADGLNVNAYLKPDIVVLDEAQRIKNWSTKTARAIKRLQSRYAFVLTGTPIENRIEELYSIIDFLNPEVLGSLFRFNREFYKFDTRGRPSEFQNLAKFRERIAPLMLRRRKSQVETELPERSDHIHFLPLGESQIAPYQSHLRIVAQLVAMAQRRALTKQEMEKLFRELNICRILCDTTYILDRTDKSCPKIEELGNILDEVLADPDIKAVIFSEWEGMLELVRELCQERHIGFAWHTGRVPQKKRRGEILLFKNDAKCRVFLSTDSGGVGLNLQNANIVINCDLPWNPAKLEQRIARVWRKHQIRPVTVVNLVSEKTIEHSMLATLESKKELADGILDGKGDINLLKLKGSSGQSFLKRINQIITPAERVPSQPPKQYPSDPAVSFAKRAAAALGGHLIGCEERYPDRAPHTVLVVIVDRNALLWTPRLKELHSELFANQDPLSPTFLEVVDRATLDSMTRLAESGILQITHRATRALHPADLPPPPLSPDELARVEAIRDRALRKTKMAKVLLAEGLQEEARESFILALQESARLLALQARLPEPSDPATYFSPSLSHAWGETRDLLNRAAQDSTFELGEPVAKLEELLKKS